MTLAAPGELAVDFNGQEDASAPARSFAAIWPAGCGSPHQRVTDSSAKTARNGAPYAAWRWLWHISREQYVG
jgi:hypothetical protein